jgi:hypothetical protein
VAKGLGSSNFSRRKAFGKGPLPALFDGKSAPRKHLDRVCSHPRVSAGDQCALKKPKTCKLSAAATIAGGQVAEGEIAWKLWQA